MRIAALVREAWASAWAAKVSSLLVAVVAAAMCATALVTVGQTAANQAAVEASLAGAGGRILIVRDTLGQGFINGRTLAAVNGLSSVDTAIGLGVTVDSVNGRIGAGGVPVTTWLVYGDVSTVVHLVAGRWPGPGEALITADAQTRLGLTDPVGFLAYGTDQYPIVGEYAPLPGFEDFATGAVVDVGSSTGAVELRVVIHSIGEASATQSAVLSILSPADSAGLSVQSPRGLSQLSVVVGGQLAGFGRNLLFLILGAGGLFVAAVVLADVLVRRRDLGRRRTLGATRTDLTALVVIRAAMSAVIGAAAGSAVALVVTAQIGYAPSPAFTIAVAVLATLTAAVAALPPAVYAARLDPVRVMRTP